MPRARCAISRGVVPRHHARAALAGRVWRRLRGPRSSGCPAVRGRPRLGCPLAGIGKMVCIGLNYTDHAEEVGLPLPAEPTVFIKAPSAICGPERPHRATAGRRPSSTTRWSWRVVIGREARYVEEAQALRHVAGYCIVNDVSERAFQMEHGGTTTKGKSADTFGPVGPWLVTADEIPDPQALRLWTTVNGERRQNGNTRRMVFPVRQLVAYVSRFMSLRPGDLISTGTPAGSATGPGRRGTSSPATSSRWASITWGSSATSSRNRGPRAATAAAEAGPVAPPAAGSRAPRRQPHPDSGPAPHVRPRHRCGRRQGR